MLSCLGRPSNEGGDDDGGGEHEHQNDNAADQEPDKPTIADQGLAHRRFIAGLSTSVDVFGNILRSRNRRQPPQDV